MIVIGIDSHKRTHTAVAADGNGRKVAETTVATTSAGHLALVRWAARFPDRRFALEDTRHLSRRLAADLLRAGEAVAWYRPGSWPAPAATAASRARATRLTRSPSPGRRSRTLACRSPRSRARSGSCGS